MSVEQITSKSTNKYKTFKTYKMLKKQLRHFLFVLCSLLFISCGSSSLEVMSYNIRYNSPNDGFNHWDNRKKSVADLIQSKSPDVIGLQEVVHQQLIDLKHYLKDYASIGVAREDGKTKGEYSPIFYKKEAFKLLNSSTFWLSKTPDTISIGWDAALERVCTYGRFEHKKSGRQFWVFNTHFDHIGQEARAASTRLILSQIKTLNTEQLPVILTGDFNLTPDTESIKRLQSKLLDNAQTFVAQFPEKQGTFNGFDTINSAERRLDYIFTKGLNLKEGKHLFHKTAARGWASDHHAVWSQLSFKK